MKNLNGLSPDGTTKIVMFVLLAIALEPMDVTSVSTSNEKLRKLSQEGDTLLVKGIEATISEKLDSIRNLTTILAQYSQTKILSVSKTADHPNDYYILVMNHVMAWYWGEIDSKFIPVLEEFIDNQDVSFPKEADINDALLGLIRLQYVYRLKARDMFEGNYMGYKGAPLIMEDAYSLGRRAFEVGKLSLTIEWLELCAELLRKEVENRTKTDSVQQTSSEYAQINYVGTLSLLGRAYFYMNDTKKAWELYHICKQFQVTGIEDMNALLTELEAENTAELLEIYGPYYRDIDENITDLCSREKEHRVSAMLPYHVCRYKSNVFIPYQRFKEEILSTSPYASVFHDVIYDAEIDRLKEIASKQGMKRGRVLKKQTQSDVRTGDIGWVSDEDPLVARVSRRVEAFTRLDATFTYSAEAMQVVNYGIGGHYDAHFDPVHNDNFLDRLATVLFYLTEVEKGGATIFPKAGIAVSPVKGMALLWYNFPPHVNSEEPGSLHAGCPVLKGNKWIANKWINIGGNMFQRPCGPSSDSKQLDVEKVVAIDALKAKNRVAFDSEE